MTQEFISRISPPSDLEGSGAEAPRRRHPFRPGIAGRLATALLLGVSASVGIVLWYVVNYGHYDEADLSDAAGLEQLEISEFSAIKGSASPLKFKACFLVSAATSVISSRYEKYENPVPLVAPNWFKCFDAQKIGEALESGDAKAYLVSANISDGIDRVVAVFADGRAYSWHQLNDKFRR